MNVQDRLSMIIGSTVIQSASLAEKIEELTAKIAEKDQEIADLKSKLLLPKDASDIWAEQPAPKPSPKTNGAGAEAA